MYKCFLKFISINKIQYKLFLEDCMLSYGYRSEKSCYTSRCFVVDLNPPFTHILVRKGCLEVAGFCMLRYFAVNGKLSL